MGFVKSALAYLPKNKNISSFFASDLGKSYKRWMAVGAGIGAFRGMADNLIGQDKVSVLGGAIQGAMWGAGARGVGQLWGSGKRIAARRAQQAVASSAVRGYANLGTSSAGAAMARGRINAFKEARNPYYWNLPNRYR